MALGGPLPVCARKTAIRAIGFGGEIGHQSVPTALCIGLSLFEHDGRARGVVVGEVTEVPVADRFGHDLQRPIDLRLFGWPSFRVGQAGGEAKAHEESARLDSWASCAKSERTPGALSPHITGMSAPP